ASQSHPGLLGSRASLPQVPSPTFACKITMCNAKCSNTIIRLKNDGTQTLEAFRESLWLYCREVIPSYSAPRSNGHVAFRGNTNLYCSPVVGLEERRKTDPSGL